MSRKKLVADTAANPSLALKAQLMVQQKLMRELTCMFAAHLINSHDGVTSVPMAIAAETFGDPNAQHGWFVMIDTLEPLGVHRIRAYTPDEQPYRVPNPVPKFSFDATDDFALAALEAYQKQVEQSEINENRRKAIADAVASFKKFREEESQCKAVEVEIPKEPEREPLNCNGTFHFDPNAPGVLCPECGRSDKILAQASA